MNTELEKPGKPRVHPKFADVFYDAEGRHFTDEELEAILEEYPQLLSRVDAAREVRAKDTAIINRVVTEIFAQYPYEKNHELAKAKCPRDVRYVVAYAVQAMLAEDARWFDDVILIWLKTILQAFDFPERVTSAGALLFADMLLEDQLKQLPRKSKSIYHTYYRVKQEMSRELSSQSFELMAPYLQQAINTLTEAY